MSGIVIGWLSGNCPVQAEGTFDEAPFYFRARGTQVTCDVGSGDTMFEWRGPEYEWPDAGWISEDMARAFIGAAYDAWKNPRPEQNAKFRRRNGLAEQAMQHIHFAVILEKALGETAKPAHDWLLAEATRLRQQESAS